MCSGNSRTTAQNAWGSTPPYQGYGWFNTSRPELVVDDTNSTDDAATPNRVRIILNARKVLDFSLVADSTPNVFVGVNGAPRTQFKTDLNNWTPRIGLSWQFLPKSVLRVGYAHIYGPSQPQMLGIHDVNYSMVFVCAMNIGLMVPPIGVGFYIACRIGDAAPEDVIRAIWPYLAALLVGVVVIAFVPWISTVAL